MLMKLSPDPDVTNEGSQFSLLRIFIIDIVPADQSMPTTATEPFPECLIMYTYHKYHFSYKHTLSK